MTESAAPGGPAMPGGRRMDGASVLVALSLLLPLLLLGAMAAIAWRNVNADAAAEVEQAAATVAEYGQRELTLHAVAAGRMDASLRGLSDEEIRAREAELHAVLKGLLDEIPGVEAGYVLDRHGAVLVSANLFPVPRDVRSGADRDFFLALSAEDAPALHVSRVHQGRLDGSQFFAVSRRRVGTGNTDLPADGFDGIVNISVFPQTLSAQLQRLRIGEQDGARLMRQDGEVLARAGGLAGPDRAGAQVVAAMAEGRDQALLTTRSMLDGQQYLVALRRVEGWPVYAAAGRPLPTITATWLREVSEQLIIGIPATLALFVGALAVRRGQRRLATARDELELRVAERTAELAEKEALLRGALEAGRVFAFSLDPATGRVERSANAADLLGLGPQQRMDDSDEAMARVDPDDRPALRAALDRLSPASPHYLIEYRWQRPDGQLAWLRSAATGRFDDAGRLVAVTGLVRDVTEEAVAERARRQSEARLRAAAEGARLGTYEIDFAARAAWFDARAAAVAGGILPADRWIAIGGPEWQALDAAIHPQDRAAYEAAWNAVASGGAEGWSVETRIHRPDGSLCWDWCHGVVVERDAAGCPRRLVGILQDVSERHRMQAELRQGQKLQALGELAGGIAHDFNNVLQAVGGAARIIERGATDDATLRRRVGILNAAVERGSAITGRLLAFARRGDDSRGPVALRELLAELQEILAATLDAGIVVALDIAPGLPRLQTDRAQLLTVLLNLATNARDAMPEGGTLTFAAETVTLQPGATAPNGLAPGAYLRLSIRDTGTGMDAATLAHAAEPFFTTKPVGQGTGLGLSMAHQFAEQAGGALQIASTPGEGTDVALWLPLPAAEACAD